MPLRPELEMGAWARTCSLFPSVQGWVAATLPPASVPSSDVPAFAVFLASGIGFGLPGPYHASPALGPLALSSHSWWDFCSLPDLQELSRCISPGLLQEEEGWGHSAEWGWETAQDGASSQASKACQVQAGGAVPMGLWARWTLNSRGNKNP